MSGLRVLITNTWLRHRAGTEMYVFDLARELLRTGHSPVVYSPQLGDFADELRQATIPVVSDLSDVGEPDVIHGHHTNETVTAMLRFPDAPALYMSHAWDIWCDVPPKLSRVHRVVAVDDTCLDKVREIEGWPAAKTQVIHNFVDLDKFVQRDPLPVKPKHALIFSNYADEHNFVPTIREACSSLNIELDIAGSRTATATDRPEQLLQNYDIVFGKARCALEAMAVGCSTILCDFLGFGGLVTLDRVETLRSQNCGRRALVDAVTTEGVRAAIASYDPADARAVSDWTRAHSGLRSTVAKIVNVYREIIEENIGFQSDMEADRRYLSRYISGWTEERWELEGLRDSHVALDAEAAALRREVPALRESMDYHIALAHQSEHELRALQSSRSLRLAQAIRRLPMVGRLLSSSH